MWYALIDSRSDCVAMTHLVWGELKNIAEQLIKECEDLISALGVDEDEDYYYFDDYDELKSCKEPNEDIIRRFSFALSDCTTDVGCLVFGYSALVDAYSKYTEDKSLLNEWKLVPKIEETDDELRMLDAELRALSDNCFGGQNLSFFIKHENVD